MPEIRHHPSICRCDIGFRRKPIVVLIVIAERTGALCLGLGNKLSSLMIFNEHWVYLVHSASVQSPSALNHPAHNLSVCFLTRHVSCFCFAPFIHLVLRKNATRRFNKNKINYLQLLCRYLLLDSVSELFVPFFARHLTNIDPESLCPI